LLKQGADVNAAQGDGMTALHWTALNGDLKTMNLLLAAKAAAEPETSRAVYVRARFDALPAEAERSPIETVRTGGAGDPPRPTRSLRPPVRPCASAARSPPRALRKPALARRSPRSGRPA